MLIVFNVPTLVTSKALVAVLADASVVVALGGSKMFATMVDQTCGALDTSRSQDGTSLFSWSWLAIFFPEDVLFGMDV